MPWLAAALAPPVCSRGALPSILCPTVQPQLRGHDWDRTAAWWSLTSQTQGFPLCLSWFFGCFLGSSPWSSSRLKRLLLYSVLALVPLLSLSLLKTLSRRLAVSISAFCRFFLPFLGLAVELYLVHTEQGRDSPGCSLPCLEGTGAGDGVFAGMELWEAPGPWLLPALKCFPTLN